jgi:hypothetical protein
MKKVVTAMLLSAAILGFQACQDEGKDTKDDKKVAEEHNDAKFDAAAALRSVCNRRLRSQPL